ncbi:MAG: glycoside hydrolase family 15 [Bacteroidaceae bacterium]|nr:glycoside hydrolase family 15 [Bacteroidaceae bacterium]
MESLYELWGKRNPEWEKKYQESVIDIFTDYGKGVNKFQDARGKIYGAGYEIFILAFFIGLYFDQTKPLIEDKAKRKVFGQAIMYWGNIETRVGRSSYPKIREYMFAALIARTDIDYIALDKGEITPRKAVDLLIDKMEQYANFGFDFIHEKLEENPNYFFKDSAFLRVFLKFLNQDDEANIEEDEEPDSLD